MAYATKLTDMMREDATTADALQSAEATRKSALAQQDALKAQIRLARLLASVGLFKAPGGAWKMPET